MTGPDVAHQLAGIQASLDQVVSVLLLDRLGTRLGMAAHEGARPREDPRDEARSDYPPA